MLQGTVSEKPKINFHWTAKGKVDVSLQNSSIKFDDELCCFCFRKFKTKFMVFLIRTRKTPSSCKLLIRQSSGSKEKDFVKIKWDWVATSLALTEDSPNCFLYVSQKSVPTLLSSWLSRYDSGRFEVISDEILSEVFLVPEFSLQSSVFTNVKNQFFY